MRVVETVGARIEAAIKRPGRGIQVGIEPRLVGYLRHEPPTSEISDGRRSHLPLSRLWGRRDLND